MRFNFEFFLKCIPELMLKIPFTLYLGIISFLASMLLAVVLLIFRNSKIGIFRWIATVFISFFRSTPYITQLFIFYYGLPQLFPALINLSAEVSFVISVALNSSAFIVEILRGGLLGVDKGQREAALSIGMSPLSMYKEIILPQAFVSAFPALGNSFISMIKNTAVGFTVGIRDILAEAKIMAASTLNFFEAYIAVGILYWIILVILDKMLKHYESKICKYL